MREFIDSVEQQLGSKRDAAAFLGYSARQYFNIRQKKERGESPYPRVASLLALKALLLKKHPFRKESSVTNQKSRLNRNAARPEFLAALKKIEPLIKAGHDRKTVHGRLAEKGFITMSYATFCRHLKEHQERPATPAPPVSSHAAAESPRPRLVKKRGEAPIESPSRLKR